MNQKTKNIIQFALLGLILIILPAGSWVYLKKGLDYQKETRADLEDLGKYDLKPLFDEPDDVYAKRGFDEKLKVVLHLHSEKQQQLLIDLNKQFKNSQGLAFVVLQAENTTREISIKENAHQLKLSHEELSKVFEDIGNPKGAKIGGIYPYFVLINEEHTIKKYYDFKDPEQVKRMIEHIAILVPKAGR